MSDNREMSPLDMATMDELIEEISRRNAGAIIATIANPPDGAAKNVVDRWGCAFAGSATTLLGMLSRLTIEIRHVVKCDILRELAETEESQDLGDDEDEVGN